MVTLSSWTRHSNARSSGVNQKSDCWCNLLWRPVFSIQTPLALEGINAHTCSIPQRSSCTYSMVRIRNRVNTPVDGWLRVYNEKCQTNNNHELLIITVQRRIKFILNLIPLFALFFPLSLLMGRGHVNRIHNHSYVVSTYNPIRHPSSVVTGCVRAIDHGVSIKVILLSRTERVSAVLLHNAKWVFLSIEVVVAAALDMFAVPWALSSQLEESATCK